jgi:hypothetical protein
MFIPTVFRSDTAYTADESEIFPIAAKTRNMCAITVQKVNE